MHDFPDEHLKKAFENGRKCREMGILPSGQPSFGTEFERAWELGWKSAQPPNRTLHEMTKIDP